jgi:hypothetical protein
MLLEWTVWRVLGVLYEVDVAVERATVRLRDVADELRRKRGPR